MKDRLRILIADDEAIRVMTLRTQLRALGFEVVAEATNGREAVELAERHHPDLAILDIKMPELDGIAAAREITARGPIPVILLTAYSEPELVERATEAGVFAYLVKPVSEEDLLPTILLARARFEEFRLLQKEVADLREALEARKVIERAKGILMKRLGISEAEAFRRMQVQSQKENKKLVEIARAIVTAHGVL
ncbi:MAG: response regulator [Armatimonadota bacterium]|nr:response regulator [Armatimonadota bacterium]MDR5675070.1 response regulator [Armatimonadota bacterium]MDR5688511.1 response regulator [Armatimonadota bacterium]MDR7386768.1 response regulator [Armatimonadota bacterium]MDR7389579.1 response regulator [Armatimonadota bacterium]